MIQREKETLLNQPGPKNEIIISEDDEEVMDGTESDTWSEIDPDTWFKTESETWSESRVDVKHESQPSLEKIEVLAEESDSDESEKNLTVLNEEQEMKTPITLGQTLVVNIGEVTITVHKGKVTIKSGKVEDISQFLNFNNSPSIFSYYIDDVITVNNPPLTSCDFIKKVVVVNKFIDLRMQDPLKDITNLQDPSILVGDNKVNTTYVHEYPPPPKRKRSSNLNHMVKKWRRGNALNAKFTLREPPG